MEMGCKNHVVGKPCNIYRLRGNPIVIKGLTYTIFPLEEYRVSLWFLQPFAIDIAGKTYRHPVNPFKHLHADVIFEPPSSHCSFLCTKLSTPPFSIWNWRLFFCSSTHTAQLRAEAEMQLAGLLERLRWSTSPLAFDCLLLDHEIYLKLVNQ